jgi:hypothetical protein
VKSTRKKYDSDGFTDSDGENETETRKAPKSVEKSIQKSVEKSLEKVVEKAETQTKEVTNSKPTEVVFISAATCPSNLNVFFVQRSSIEATYTAIQDCLLELPLPGTSTMQSMKPSEIEPYVYGLHYSPEDEENDDPGWKRAQVSEVLESGDLQLIYVDNCPLGTFIEKCNPKDFYVIPAEFQSNYDKHEECATCVIFEGTQWPGPIESFLSEVDEGAESWDFQFLEKEPLDNYYNYVKCEEIQRIAQKYQ